MKSSKKRKAPKKRSAPAKALGSAQYRQRVVPAKNKSRGRKRMAEIYAREWACVESEKQL